MPGQRVNVFIPILKKVDVYLFYYYNFNNSVTGNTQSIQNENYTYITSQGYMLHVLE